MKPTLFVVFLQFVVFIVQAKTLSLSESVQYALEKSPIISAAKKLESVSQLELQNASSRLLPSLDLTVTHGYQRQRPADLANPYTSQISFNLTENLYDNGESWTKLKVAKLNKSIAEINTIKARDKAILAIAQEFFQFSLFTKLLEVKKSQLVIYQKQFETVSSQYRQGIRMRKDFLRLKAQVQRGELEVLNAENSLTTSAFELRKLLGSPNEPLDFKAIEPNQSKIAFPTQKLTTQTSYDFRMATFQEDVRNLNVDLFRRNTWPQVSVTLGAFYQNSGYLQPVQGADGLMLNNNGETFGANGFLTLKYSIFDWGIRRRNSEMALVQKTVADEETRLNLNSIETEIKNLVLELNRQQKAFDVQRQLLESESQSYDLLQRDYREGKVAYLDMVTSLNDLLAAKVGYYSTYFSALRSIAEFNFHEGSLYEKIRNP